ncbi:MAG: PQQ-like beta-propeller repeat protein [Verrucomicrobia bacterium]|nr:PQQ-like beta-propeller repeat protein [Verrucomicrobiota bacterium]
MKASSASILFLIIASIASAADWPTFRGGDRRDISTETGLLKQWPEAGPKKIWTSDKGGLGYAGFSVADGTLFTMGARDGKEFLLALDAATGKEKWITMLGDLLTNNWGDGPRGTPTVDGDRVYALSGEGDLVCANTKNGNVLWKAKMSDFGGKIPGWGYTESVLVDGDKVICTPGGSQGTLLALEKASGKKVWQSAGWDDPAQYASVIVAEHAGIRQYIQLTMKHVGGVDATTGKAIWLSDWGGRTAVIPTPIFHEGKVYITSGYGVGCKLIDLGASNAPEEAWSNQNMVNHHGGVILVGDSLYGYSDKGGWTCQDWATGDVKWSEKKLGKGAIHCADGMFYLLEESSGTVVLIEASPDAWREHGRFKLEPQSAQRKPQGKIWTHPVVCNGRLYLRDQEFISCYDVKG